MQKKNLSLVHEVMAPEQASEKPPLLIMLHGFGSHEQDLFSMAPMLNTKFMIVSARAPLTLPWGGFAWYEINFEELGGGKMSNIPQARDSVGRIETFVKEAQEAYGADPDNTWLMGFSQGCMMSINLGLTSNKNFNCIVGFSGKIIDKDNLFKRKISNTKMLLLHGDLDEVVPSVNLLEAKDFLNRNNVEVEINMIKNCGHHIPVEASSLALGYIKKNLKI